MLKNIFSNIDHSSSGAEKTADPSTSEQSSPIIELKNVVKSFPVGDGEVIILKKVSFKGTVHIRSKMCNRNRPK